MRNLIFLILFFSVYGLTNAQNNTGIGTTTPNSNALLELDNNSNPLGLLLPRQDISTFAGLGASENGLMVFNTVDNKVYTWNGSSWVSSTSEWGINGNDIFNLNSGNVGIGLNNPGALLNVNGILNQPLLLLEGSGLIGGGLYFTYRGTTEGYEIRSDDQGGINMEASGFHKISFQTNSTEQMRIAANGNVGIGTVSPAQKLHIIGDIQINNISAGNGNGANVTNTRFGEQSFNALTTGGWNTAVGYIALRSTTIASANSALGCFALADNITGGSNTGIGYQALRATSSGIRNTALGLDAGLANTTGSNNTLIGASANVGSNALSNATAIGANAIVNTSNSLILGDPNTRVGIGTSSPLGVLQIEDADWNSNSVILNSNGIVGSAIRFQNSSVGNHTYDIIGSTGTGASTGAGYFGIYDNTAFAYRFVISPAGQVGIATNTPTATMHVAGTGIYTGRLELTGTTDASGIPGTGVLEIANGVRIDGNEIITNTNATLFFQNDNNGDFAVDASTFYVDASANSVGIGTTTPSNWGKLHVAAGSFAADGTSAQGLKWVTGNTLQADMFRWGNSNNALYVTNNGLGNLTGVYLLPGATNWTSSSDKRLKENIIETSYGLNEILQLSPKEYNFITTEKKDKRIGFLAQDVYEVIPDIVEKGDNGVFRGEGNAQLSSELGFVPWGINYTDLVPVLVKAVQELNEENQKLKTRIDSLESK